MTRSRPLHEPDSILMYVSREIGVAYADGQNPFITSPSITSPRSPSHPILSPALASLDQVSEHIQRQERLIRASEQMKQGLRRTIANLQKEKEDLMAENKELKKRVSDN
jgi:hypothetical protein